MRRILGWAAWSGSGAVLAAAAVGGVRAGSGFLIGAFAAAFGLAGWVLVAMHLGQRARRRTAGLPAWAAPTAAFVLKIPFFVAAAVLVHRMGGPGPVAFVLGVAWVYSLAVIWAARLGQSDSE